MILIDSAFETACRSYLQHRAKIKLSDAHRHRENLISTMKGKLPTVDVAVWDSINFYYEEIRCDFYHQSAGKTITDTALLDYRDIVEFVIDNAFGTTVRAMVDEQLAEVLASDEPHEGTILPPSDVHVVDVKERADKILVGIAQARPKNVSALNAYFKREGEPLRLKPGDFTNVVARHSGSKKLFYFDRTERAWNLSKSGLKRLSLLKGANPHA